jgi:putative NADH-flavin reductase
MPKYAILGATGSTGSEILRQLLDSPVNMTTLHLYVRSRSKLERLFPSLATRPNVQIYEGSVDDTALMSGCLAHTDVVFSCVAENENVPGVRVAQDTCRAIIMALKAARQTDNKNNINSSSKPVPHVVVLSAAPLHPVVATGIPAFLRWLLNTAFSHVYADLAKAQDLLRSEHNWLPVTIMYPPGLAEGPAQGHRLLYTAGKTSFVSYVDLAAAMIEVAERGPDEAHNWVGIGTMGTESLKPDVRILLGRQLRGLLGHFSPRLWRMLHARGWF